MRDWDRALDAMNELRPRAQRCKRFACVCHADEETPEQLEELHHMMTNAAEQLDSATPIWVSKDICTLIEFASESFKPEPVLASDLIVQSAFVYLEQGFTTSRPDDPNDSIVCNAFTWEPSESWDVDEPIDQPGHEGVAVTFWSDYQGMLLPWEWSTTDFGDTHDEGVAEQAARYLQVLWRLSQQQIASSQDKRVSRAAGRRPSNWREINTVQVMTLRRRKHRAPHTEADIGWSHRWLVNAHWRNQWYASEQAHRQILIAPYVKGPDDKPFVPKQRVIDFSR